MLAKPRGGTDQLTGTSELGNTGVKGGGTRLNSACPYPRDIAIGCIKLWLYVVQVKIAQEDRG